MIHCEVIVVGAGVAGIGAGIKLKEQNVDFIILEKASEIGGVWRENTYPGCGCDVPSFLYSYSFNPNPHWSSIFAKQEEIKSYLMDTVTKFHIQESISFNSEMLSASWDTQSNQWVVHTLNEQYSSNFIILACGPMHVPVTPKIQGAETFTGQSFHSAEWDHNISLDSKRVAVIGSGASAIQFVPEIQKEVQALNLFQRTPPWVIPKPDRLIPTKWRSAFKKYPFLQSSLRSLLYLQLEFFNRSLKSARLSNRITKLALSNIHRFIKDKALIQLLTPNFSIGCKRILLSNNWYKALIQTNVHLFKGIKEIKGSQLIAEDGSTCEVDLLIYATGFEVANPPIAKRIFGKTGVALDVQWQGTPKAYLGSMTPDCPNLFLTFGPNLYTFTSAFVIAEAQFKFIVSAILKARKHSIHSIEVKTTVLDSYNKSVYKDLELSVWNSGCSSYFLDKNGVNSSTWPWSIFKLRRKLRRLKLKDYDIVR